MGLRAPKRAPLTTTSTHTLHHVREGVYAVLDRKGNPLSGGEHMKVYLDPQDWFDMSRPETIEVTVRVPSVSIDELKDLTR